MENLYFNEQNCEKQNQSKNFKAKTTELLATPCLPSNYKWPTCRPIMSLRKLLKKATFSGLFFDLKMMNTEHCSFLTKQANYKKYYNILQSQNSVWLIKGRVVS